MKCIIIIRGVAEPDYPRIKADLMEQLSQLQVQEKDMPLFCWLPGEYAEIDIVWLDEAMAIEEYRIAMDKSHRQSIADANKANEDTLEMFRVMRAKYEQA